jgi:hypothetical protein
MRCRDLAEFFKARPGLFRVDMAVENPPNIGNLYGVQTLQATTATETRDFLRFRTTVPRAPDLLNVRYTVKRSSAADADPVWSDADWKVYQNPTSYPRAWVVYEVSAESDADRVFSRLRDPGFNPLREAIVSGPSLPRVDVSSQPSAANVTVDAYLGNALELSVDTAAAGLLVVSETHFPGWRAWVDGRPVHIYKVDGLLRGVEVPSGRSKVVMRYRPASVILGGVLSLISVAGAVVLPWISRRRLTSPEW